MLPKYNHVGSDVYYIRYKEHDKLFPKTQAHPKQLFLDRCPSLSQWYTFATEQGPTSMVQFLLYMIYTNVKMPQKKPFMVRYMPVNFAYFQDTLELIQAKGNLKKKKKKVASCKCPSGKVSSQGKTGQSTKGSSSKSTRSTKSCGEQYQLNMADIPFLRGKVWL